MPRGIPKRQQTSLRIAIQPTILLLDGSDVALPPMVTEMALDDLIAKAQNAATKTAKLNTAGTAKLNTAGTGKIKMPTTSRKTVTTGERKSKPRSFLGHTIHPTRATMKQNPRRGGVGYDALEIVRADPGLSVEDYYARGGRPNDLRWDIQHTNVKLRKLTKPQARSQAATEATTEATTEAIEALAAAA